MEEGATVMLFEGGDGEIVVVVDDDDDRDKEGGGGGCLRMGVVTEEEKEEKMDRDHNFFEFLRRNMYSDDCEFLGFSKQLWWNLL